MIYLDNAATSYPKPPEGIGRRLMDLGFTPGAETACLLAAPGNGMRAYLIRGTVIALRRKEARQVILKEERNE